MNLIIQEISVVVIIGGTTCFAVFHVFRTHFALPMAQWLLKRGKVKWAMRIRKLAI